MKTILAKLLGISRTFLDWILPILQSQAAISLERLAPIAIAVVADLATNNNLRNEEKRSIAVARITDAARAEGIASAVSLINLAVELAVAKTKAQ